MTWNEVRAAYPKQWLVVEALEARTLPDDRRIVERFAVVDTCQDGRSAMLRYQALHREYPERELYFVHTQREELDIRERRWVGVRCGHAVGA
ncbi:MAG: hypothetical protein HY900_15375 [Deltaproteobacteria bacterium]|nr:hypothetical protein [Deltaproteobacteria bacterium]